MKYKLSLSIPHYNEETNVGVTIPRIFRVFSKAKIPLEIVAVNNGSKDNTLQALKNLQKKYKNLKIVSIRENQGFGGGILAGLKRCSAEYVGFTCADEQIAAEDILKLYQTLVSRKLDIAKTNRIVRNDGSMRFLYSRLFNTMCSLLFGVYVRDINGYPVLMKKSLFESMKLYKKDWMINMEMLVKSRRLGASHGEIDVIFHKRKLGTSHIKVATLFGFFYEVLKLFVECHFLNKCRVVRKKEVL